MIAPNLYTEKCEDCMTSDHTVVLLFLHGFYNKDSDAVIKAWLVLTEATNKTVWLAVENAHHLLLNFL